MKFFAISDNKCIITDDYTQEEINNCLHIKNIIKDYEGCTPLPSVVRVFDENHNLIGALKCNKHT